MIKDEVRRYSSPGSLSLLYVISLCFKNEYLFTFLAPCLGNPEVDLPKRHAALRDCWLNPELQVCFEGLSESLSDFEL